MKSSTNIIILFHRKKFGKHLKDKDENSSSFMEETSRSLAYRLSNIFGAPDDIYIPGLDDDPKQKKTSNSNQAHHQTMTAFTQRNKGSLSINMSMSGEHPNQANTFREPDNKYRTDIKRGSGNKNIYNHRESEASRTEPSENFDTSGPGDKGAEVEEEVEATVGNASVAQTYFNMLKCFIGIGILATPAAVQTVGIVGGTFGIMCCGLLNMYTMKMQIACKEKVGSHISSYSELGLAVLGARGQAFIDLCITIS